MGIFDSFKKAEVRSLENPNASVSAENFLHIMGWCDCEYRQRAVVLAVGGAVAVR
jgi:hypothetical protein